MSQLMDLKGISTLVTGGASGLGLATAQMLTERGAQVVILDLPSSSGEKVASALKGAVFSPGDVVNGDDVEAALDLGEKRGALRAIVHCAGRSGPVRIVERDGSPGSIDTYRAVIETNLVGSFNVLRLAAARMVGNEPLEEDRGVIILTASIAAFEGQIGQIPYASSKAGIVGMTIVAARDLAHRGIRVCTIAPGTFDTPLLARVPEDVRASLAAAVPHPSRLGSPREFAQLALQIVENPMLNGETIRLDGAIRMPPR
jgi:NAD(P)-dependent dehydrogenase (short-subunit alcohol dehydrogenase family)